MKIELIIKEPIQEDLSHCFVCIDGDGNICDYECNYINNGNYEFKVIGKSDKLIE